MSLPELLAVLALSGILFGIGSLGLLRMEAPLDTGSRLLDSALRQARAKAMSTTTAYQVTPVDGSNLVASYANLCTDTVWTLDPRLDVELPDGVTLTDTTWVACFSSRGHADSNATLTVQDSGSDTRQVEVLIGGMTRILP
jgi:prepilin-type N-terminal cleavage/methylation domain-containing protein